MRLLHATSLKFKSFSDAELPPYAILSHTWDEKEEVTLQDMASPYLTDKTGYNKIVAICKLALEHGFKYAWIDTCCIDKTNNTELTESINSMFRWYRNAAICFVYLADLEHVSDIKMEGDRMDPAALDNRSEDPLRRLDHCAWFRRGWTLQELLAPRRVDFYDSAWKRIGSKDKLAARLSEITRIPAPAIVGEKPLGRYSTAQRMAWASNRITTRVEDAAYSLLGLFDVNMPLIYGEGPRAFHRLQEEIIKRSTDLTLFAWLPSDSHGSSHNLPQKPVSPYCPLLALSPADFSNCHLTLQFRHDDSEFTMTNRGLRITTYLVLMPIALPRLGERSIISKSMDQSSLGGGGGGNNNVNITAGSSRSSSSSKQRYRYVLSIGYIESSVSEVGIWLKKIGPGLFLREASPTLARLSKRRLQKTNTTENHTFNILLHPSTASAASTKAQFSSATLMSPPPPSFTTATTMMLSGADHSNKNWATDVQVSAKAAAAASASATTDNLSALYHPRLFPRGIHVPCFSDRGIFFSSPPPDPWDERTRIFCQPESRNDVVAFSCSSRQGRHHSSDDELSFGVLLDYRQMKDVPRCLVIDRCSLESRFLFVLAMRQQGDPVRWYVMENELPSISASSDVLRIYTDGGRTYEVVASIVFADVEIDDCMTEMYTLDIKITNVTASEDMHGENTTDIHT